MALSIRNSEAERLARTVASQTGESLTEAIEQALRERLERLQRQRGAHGLAEKLDDILARVDALPTVDSRTADKILGSRQTRDASLMVIDTSAILATSSPNLSGSRSCICSQKLKFD
jgi:antitoxin VapB